MGYSFTPSGGESPEIGEVRYSRFTLGSEWLLLDGSIHNVDDYPVLGALYGGSVGGTFTVDDFRGVALYGADGSNASGIVTGTDSVSVAHTHGVGALSNTSAGGHNHGGATGQTGTVVVGPPQLLGNINVTPANATPSISTDGAHTHSISGSTASALTTIDKRPRRGYLNVYIRAL